ncbi:hypothetical protein ABIE56_002394 [Luteibacter sp. 621]|uniref:hypothetical protein n=1 Tax=Luteibacter sp. 621 TaxID=3373916 RepID=UPI003D230399
MTDSYPARVRANILPRSNAQTLPEAFAEWAWTGGTEDHGSASETCELCEQESLRYHFEIHNDHTFATLRVGSTCILRWQMGVQVNGKRLSQAAAKTAINDALKRMQRAACIRALEAVLAAEPNEILQSALVAYRDGKALTPKQINVVFWRLDTAGIEYNPSFFKVDLRKERRWDDLRAMRPFQRDNVWKAMTSAQRASAMRRGISGPATHSFGSP